MKRRTLLSFGAAMPLAALANGIVKPIEVEPKYHYLFRTSGMTEWSFIQFTEDEIKQRIYDVFRHRIEKKELISFGLVITSSDLSPRLSSNAKIPLNHMFADEIPVYVDDVFKKYQKSQKTS